VITVAGEALMDVLVDGPGTLTALPGGAPFNVARILARLGTDCVSLGRISDDAFGEQLRAALRDAGVTLAVPEPTRAPTTLAVAQLDKTGSAEYRLYHDGTAAGRLGYHVIPPGLLESAQALALGGLGIVLEPIRSSLLELVRHAPSRLTVLLDPNCRPRAIRDLGDYRATVREFLGRVDIVKVSVDDLSLLSPGVEPLEAVRWLIATGPQAVLVTDGPRPVTVVTVGGSQSVAVPEIAVVDTIGAGDAFVAAFLAWWARRGMGRAQTGDLGALVAGAGAAVQVAVQACLVKGAGLPVDFRWGCGEAATVDLSLS
jgi:fructokinase